MLAGVAARVRKKGFEGPFYRGALGKLRFVAESTLWRRELVFAATPAGLAPAPATELPLVLHPVRSFAEVEPFRAGLEAEYYPGYVEPWRDPFTWGETAVVGTVDGAAACFAWLQRGTPEGFPTYYNRIFEGEARILRVGVVPSFRRRGLNTLLLHRMLEGLFAEGASRVFIECYQYNVPSARAFVRVGFRAVGLITVVELPMMNGFIRWAPPGRAAEELRRILT
jgi:GNAT superfamily N-acetyltransferase